MAYLLRVGRFRMRLTKTGALLDGLRRIFASEARGRGRSVDGRQAPQPRQLPVGRFSLVGLRHVQSELGERWPALAERVHALAEAVISRHLLSSDVFERDANGDYVVLFCQLGEREAEFKARAIGREITERLLGSEWDQLSRVEGVASAIPRTVVVTEDLDATLETAFAKGRRFVTAHCDVRDHEDEALPAAAAPIGASSEIEAFASDRGLIIEERSASAARPRPTAVRIARPDPVWRYAPIWDFRQQALIHFRIVPANGRRNEGLDGPALQQAVFAADLAALRRAVSDIIRLAGLDRRLPVTCPLNGATLDHPAPRRLILDELKSLPLHVRRLLRLELAPPPGWSRSRPVEQFMEAAAALKSPVCTRLATHPGSLPLLADMPGPVTLQLPSGRLPEAKCIRFLEAFSDRAQAAGVDSGVAGIATRSLAMAASAAGFRFLSGRAIHAEVSALDKAVRFDLSRLYEDLLPKSA